MVSFVCLAFSMDESYQPPGPEEGGVPISREEVLTDLPRLGSERTGPLPLVPVLRVRRDLDDSAGGPGSY